MIVKISFILLKIASMKRVVLVLIISLLVWSCNDQNDYIQDVYVNENINLSLPEYSDILIPGNSIFIDGGVEGIIIYLTTNIYIN